MFARLYGSPITVFHFSKNQLNTIAPEAIGLFQGHKPQSPFRHSTFHILRVMLGNAYSRSQNGGFWGGFDP